MRSLVVGGTTEGGIGQAVVKLLRRTLTEVWAPTPEEMDITNTWSIEKYVEEHGAFDELVYAAGVPQLKWSWDMTIDDLQKVFAVNTFGLPVLVGRLARYHNFKPCSVVAIVSDASHTPMRGSLAYCASKAGEAMAVRCLAREMASYGWRVNGVSPGVVEGTPMTKFVDETVPKFRDWTPEQARDYALSSIPTGKFVTRDEVAKLVYDVLTGPASLTGAIIEINGGK